MEVNDNMLNKLATLAKLRFNDEERAAIKTDLQNMIGFIQKMDEVDTSGVEPLLHMSSMVNTWRVDEINGSCSREAALKNSGKHNDQFFMVPAMIKK